MCGICGIVAIDGVLDPALHAALPGMTAALRHRGPDDEGFFRDSRASLGHRRLSIIDRAGGRQPMSNEDGRCWIVFNGEIYNHRELRTQLTARGHRFGTASDTEAIVHAWEEWGADCVDRLEGMFAFAIYDRLTGDVLLARDRLGKKPLFYAMFGRTLHFASEMKALRRSPAWNGTLDLDGIETYLSLGYFVEPATIYRGVRALEPGHWLHLSNGHTTVRQYWDVREFDTDGRAEPALLAELDRLLHERVVERLESDVALGAFLSGGIDSGLVVSHMSDARSGSVETTTVGFADTAHNEIEAASRTAAHLGTRHHAQVVDTDLTRELDPIVAAFDQPFADASAVPTWHVSAAARRHVTVALSGDGGDETFGGYGFRYVPHALEDRVRRMLPSAARTLAGAMGRVWPRTRNLPRWLRIGGVLENIRRDPAAAYYWDLCFTKPDIARALTGRDPEGAPFATGGYEAVTGAYRRCTSADAVQRAEYADLKIYLPNDVLVKVDRMSMAHGLEVRCPLLDRRIVEFAFRVPVRAKMPRLEEKHLLRRLAGARLPRDLVNLPKKGFTAPVASWLRHDYRTWFHDDVLAAGAAVGAYVDVSLVRKLYTEHVTGESDHWFPLWAVWMLARWMRIDARAPL